MEHLVIMTRSYIRPDGTWDMSDKTIESVLDLINEDGRVEWVIFISSIGRVSKSEMDRISSFKNKVGVYTYITDDRCNTGVARVKLAGLTLQYMKTYSYAINVDSDDEVLVRQMLRLLNTELPTGLIGYGWKTKKGSWAEDQLNLNLDKVNERGRYSTRDLQCPMLFIYDYYSLKYISRLSEIPTLHFRPQDHVSDSEYPEDVYLACEISSLKSIDQFNSPRISLIADNLVRYNEHELQNSLRQTSEDKMKSLNTLKEVGYLYVDFKFYKISDDSSKYVEFIPTNHKIKE